MPMHPMPGAVPRQPRRRCTSHAPISAVDTQARITVASAFSSGVAPSLSEENTTIGKVGRAGPGDEACHHQIIQAEREGEQPARQQRRRQQRQRDAEERACRRAAKVHRRLLQLGAGPGQPRPHHHPPRRTARRRHGPPRWSPRRAARESSAPAATPRTAAAATARSARPAERAGSRSACPAPPAPAPGQTAPAPSPPPCRARWRPVADSAATSSESSPAAFSWSSCQSVPYHRNEKRREHGGQPGVVEAGQDEQDDGDEQERV